MATKIVKNEKREQKISRNRNHAAALIAGLGDHPEEWVYTGQVYDMGGKGTCVCGQENIRWGFEITKDNEFKVLGSSCINNYASINIDVYNMLKEAHNNLIAQINADKKAAKEARQQAEVDHLKEEYKVLYLRLREIWRSYYNVGKRAPYALWEAEKELEM